VENSQIKTKNLNKDLSTKAYLFSKCGDNDASKTQDPEKCQIVRKFPSFSSERE
jgi:hypothetical protein